MKTLYLKWDNSDHAAEIDFFFFSFLNQSPILMCLSSSAGETFVPPLVKHEDVLSHTELLLRV